MKKGMEYTGTVEKVLFPNRGIVRVEGEEESVIIKNVIPGQKVRFVVSKKRRKIEGRLLAVLAPSPLETASDPCPHFPICGGCLYQTLPYEEQLALKEGQIEELLSPLLPFREIYGGMLASPFSQEYRNKMELTFGDREPGGELTLGMHRRGSFYDVLETTDCRLMDADMRTVARVSLQFFRDKGITYYHKRTHRGYLRHLLLRKAKRTGEMLICLVTSTDHAGMTREAAEPGFAKSYGQENEEELLSDWREALLSQTYEGSIAGILHTRNDRPADVVEDQGTTVLFGKNHFREEILGLTFTITPFSFFQTNSLGAEVLYSAAREAILSCAPEQNTDDDNGENTILDIDPAGTEREIRDGALVNEKSKKQFGRVFDLYSGTGTIAQIVAEVAEEVVGVELVPEAVEAAKVNAEANHITNCRFIAGDVLKVLDELSEPPEFIVLDPPRDGVHPKALPRILDYGADNILYISCKATSLARDLPIFFEKGYQAKKVWIVDLFPMTGNVETVCLLSNRKADSYVKLNVKMEDYYRIKDSKGGEADG